MREFLMLATEYVAMFLDAMALLAIAIGTLETVIKGGKWMLSPSATNHQRRMVWSQYARWLVAALTFQLAADIIETAYAPDWDTIGRLAVIALIRTFLNYFLEKDIAEVRERDQEAARHRD